MVEGGCERGAHAFWFFKLEDGYPGIYLIILFQKSCKCFKYSSTYISRQKLNMLENVEY